MAVGTTVAMRASIAVVAVRSVPVTNINHGGCGGVSPDPTVPQIEAALAESARCGQCHGEGKFYDYTIGANMVCQWCPKEPKPGDDMTALRDAPRYLGFLLERVKELEAIPYCVDPECEYAMLRHCHPEPEVVSRESYDEAIELAHGYRMALEAAEARAVAAETALEAARELLADCASDLEKLAPFHNRAAKAARALLASVPSQTPQESA